jgi:hypothetical protein
MSAWRGCTQLISAARKFRLCGKKQDRECGTSPLHAFVTRGATGHALPTAADVLGIVSLIWRLVLVLRADNDGEVESWRCCRCARRSTDPHQRCRRW